MPAVSIINTANQQSQCNNYNFITFSNTFITDNYLRQVLPADKQQILLVLQLFGSPSRRLVSVQFHREKCGFQFGFVAGRFSKK